MHSEVLADHDLLVEIYKSFGGEMEWVNKHRDIIAKYGRYPHRNTVLGRKSTPEEDVFAKEHGGF